MLVPALKMCRFYPTGLMNQTTSTVRILRFVFILRLCLTFVQFSLSNNPFTRLDRVLCDLSFFTALISSARFFFVHVRMYMSL